MGIPGLLKELGKGDRVALAKIATDHFDKYHRPLRVAIDAAIWNFQTQSGQGGKNPALRTFFFRLLRLLSLPIHPVFVYDGKNKPLTKRGKTVSRYGTCVPNELSKNLVARFQFPHHTAPGEAEAECAYLQRNGIVDAVMSQDVDAIMFGSTLTLRDWSKEGTKGNKGPTHVNVYDHVKIKDLCGLDSPGMILVALLSGGDYSDGVAKFGASLSCQIAKAGFGEELVTLIQDNDEDGLKDWRERLQYELETNESGYFLKRHMTVKIPEDFPDRTVLRYYLTPAVSNQADLRKLEARWTQWWEKEIDVPALREYTVMTFDWLYKGGARSFVRHLAQPLFQHRLKQKQVRPEDFSTKDITETRKHFINDGLAELRLSVVPANVVGIDIEAEEDNPEFADVEAEEDLEAEEAAREASIEPATEPSSPSKRKKRPPWDPYKAEKWWILETLLATGMPAIVEAWHKEQLETRADPLTFATRKCKPPAKARVAKKIDESMKEGAIKDFLGFSTTGSTNVLPRTKKPLERAKTDTVLIQKSQTLEVDAFFKPSKASKTTLFPTAGLRGVQVEKAVSLSDNNSDNEFDIDILDLLHKPSRLAPSWLRDSKDDQHFVNVAASPSVTRRKKKTQKAHEYLDDDIVYVGSKQIPPLTTAFLGYEKDSKHKRVLGEHSTARTALPSARTLDCEGGKKEAVSLKPGSLTSLHQEPIKTASVPDTHEAVSAHRLAKNTALSLEHPRPIRKATTKMAIIRESLPGTWNEIPLTPSQTSGVAFVDLTNT